MRNILFAIVALAGVALVVSTASADPTVEFYITTVSATNTSGTWQVYADVSNDNDGLCDFDIDVLGGGGAQITSKAKLRLPTPIDPSGQYADGNGGNMGFSFSYDSSGTLSGGNLTQVIAGQSIIYQGADDPTRDMGIFVGVGQENASVSSQNGSQGPIDGSGTPTGLSNSLWTYQPSAQLPGGNGLSYPVAGTLIEQGTYSTNGGINASLTVQPETFVGSQVLGTGEPVVPTGVHYPGFYPGGSNQLWGYDPYELGDSPFATSTGDTIALVPEPGAIGLIVGLGTALLALSRRFRTRPI